MAKLKFIGWTMRQYLFAMALASLAVSPVSAQTGSPLKGHGAQAGQAFGAVTPFGNPVGNPGPVRMNNAREAAIRECNAVAAKWYPTRDSNISFQQYRMCMAQHGHME